MVRAVLDYATIACGDARLVSFGNAPIQSCDYARLVQDSGALTIADFYSREAGAVIGPYDLRQLSTRWSRLGTLSDRKALAQGAATIVDLGPNSWLEELFQSSSPAFRVGDYPPSDMMSHHALGLHSYVISRRLLEADVVISVSKLKTHRNVGISCALKNSIGAVARKECLAHFRKGDPSRGGDEYPQASRARAFSSWLADRAAEGDIGFFSNMLRVQSKILSRLLTYGKNGVRTGGWHGNDTAWRMVLDVARILRYATIDGILRKTPQRAHLVFVDGIVAGEGEGPLRPKPLPIGMTLFSPNECAADVVSALIMGFDPNKIPMVARSFAPQAFPLNDGRLEDISIILDGRSFDPSTLPALSSMIPTKGWIGMIERDSNDPDSL
jgi:hypothetical protein